MSHNEEIALWNIPIVTVECYSMVQQQPESRHNVFA